MKSYQDLRRLHSFIAHENPAAAQRAIRSIRDGVKVLATNPSIGRPAFHLGENFREWLIEFGASIYVIRYQVQTDRIVLLRIRHGRESGY
jgi:plasmid stabilization system protein ParE